MKGDRKDPGPSSPLCEIFETLLNERMMNYFCESNNLLHGTQFGFRSKTSCVHAISTVTEYIKAAREKEQSGLFWFIDVQKAFDTINHEIRLQKWKIMVSEGNPPALMPVF